MNDILFGGVDIGGSHITCGLVKKDGKLVSDTIVNKKMSGQQGIEIIRFWWEAINELLENIEADVSGIGIAIPGPFDYPDGVALFNGSNKKFQSIYGVDVKSELLSNLAFNGEIRFVNDAAAFGIGESWVGTAKDYDRSVVITLGTGFGSAIIQGDTPLFFGKGVPEDGCFWHLPFKGGIADDYFSTRWLIHRFQELTGLKVKGVREMAVLYPTNAHVSQVFSEFGSMLGEFLLPWLEELESEVIVIGGNISRALDYFRDSFVSFLESFGISLEVLESELMEASALIGSVRTLDETYWKEVKNQIPKK